jgi:hypothetical protein
MSSEIRVASMASKAAVTVRLAVMVTTQDRPVAVSQPAHAMKLAPGSGVASRVTTVPVG